MPGMTLGIGYTNPKKGAVQFDSRRIDGVPFVIPSAATITSAPIGSIVTLQECAALNTQRIVLGANAYTDASSNAYTVIAVGFLEAATQVDGSINQTVGYYLNGDNAAMIIDINVVASCPMDPSNNPSAGITSVYINKNGQLSSSSSTAVAFPGVVFFQTAGQQTSGQLVSGNCFARLATNMIGTV